MASLSEFGLLPKGNGVVVKSLFLVWANRSAISRFTMEGQLPVEACRTPINDVVVDRWQPALVSLDENIRVETAFTNWPAFPIWRRRSANRSRRRHPDGDPDSPIEKPLSCTGTGGEFYKSVFRPGEFLRRIEILAAQPRGGTLR
jgi:hypothetical protein